MAEERPTDAWLIKYEDPDRADEVFSGYGAGQGARARFADISTSWNATLFRSVTDNFSVPLKQRRDKVWCSTWEAWLTEEEHKETHRVPA